MSRREFIKLSGASSAFLVIGLKLPEVMSATDSSIDPVLKSNIWIKIDKHNFCTVTLPESELGQGIYTGLATLVAEELDIDWQKIKIERATSLSIYGYQSTGGSNSIRKRWFMFREMAAITRQVFIQAAAKIWGVPEINCYTRNATVHDASSDKQLRYADLITQANLQTLPEKVELKSTDSFNLIGKNIQRIDALNKVNGEAVFGADVQIPDMLIATTIHAPVFGSTIGKINTEEALKLSGVVKVIKIQDAVAVIAKNTWSAFQAAKLVDIQWQLKSNGLDSDTIKRDMQLALKEEGITVVETGKDDISSGVEKISVEYSAPFQAHATMEPMCCCAHIHDGVCEVWAPTQSPSKAKSVAKAFYYNLSDQLLNKVKSLLKLQAVEDVIVHTTYSGGGFGRRLQQDFVAEAVQIAINVSRPVKLIWSREEDIQHDFYRTTAMAKLQASLNSDGYPVSISHRIVSPSLRESLRPGSLASRNGIDGSAVGGAVNIPYDVKHHKVTYKEYRTSIPLGHWRSVGSSINAFHIEAFIDELAALKNIDAFKYRQSLLANSPRLLNTLNQVAELSQWKRDAHGYYGIACHSSFGSHVSQVAKLVNDNGKLKIEHIYCVIDCGLSVNPDVVKSQLEGSIIYALSSLKSEITILNGRVKQSNFHDYSLLRFNRAPLISCRIVDSSQDPGGVGEPGVPPAIPAVLNAVFAATGNRIRDLPVKPSVLVV